MAVFYLDDFKDNEIKQTIEIKEGELFHHLRNVLRIRGGETVKFFNNNSVFQTKIDIVTKERISCMIESVTPIKLPFPRIILVQSTIKKELIEVVLKLNVPFFVKSFIFFKATRSQFELNEKNILRFHKIALSIAEQSEVCYKPEIKYFKELENAIKEVKDSFVITLHPGVRESIGSFAREISNFSVVSLFTGPEGGFTENEIKVLKSYGAYFVSLKSGIFKSEFAGFVAAAILRELV